MLKIQYILYRNLKNLNDVETTSNPHRILVESSSKRFRRRNLIETSSKPHRFLAESSPKSSSFRPGFDIEMTMSKRRRNLIDFSPNPRQNPHRFDADSTSK